MSLETLEGINGPVTVSAVRWHGQKWVLANQVSEVVCGWRRKTLYFRLSQHRDRRSFLTPCTSRTVLRELAVRAKSVYLISLTRLFDALLAAGHDQDQSVTVHKDVPIHGASMRVLNWDGEEYVVANEAGHRLVGWPNDWNNGLSKRLRNARLGHFMATCVDKRVLSKLVVKSQQVSLIRLSDLGPAFAALSVTLPARDAPLSAQPPSLPDMTKMRTVIKRDKKSPSSKAMSLRPSAVISKPKKVHSPEAASLMLLQAASIADSQDAPAPASPSASSSDGSISTLASLSAAAQVPSRPSSSSSSAASSSSKASSELSSTAPPALAIPHVNALNMQPQAQAALFQTQFYQAMQQQMAWMVGSMSPSAASWGVPGTPANNPANFPVVPSAFALPESAMNAAAAAAAAQQQSQQSQSSASSSQGSEASDQATPMDLVAATAAYNEVLQQRQAAAAALAAIDASVALATANLEAARRAQSSPQSPTEAPSEAPRDAPPSPSSV